MIALVTGSSGFIGRWVCDTLNIHGITPVGLDLREKPLDQGWLEFYQCDILDKAQSMESFSKSLPSKSHSLGCTNRS